MYMDSTAKNIKCIIQPYEDKIRQLEEIIKQKDFEIIVLKQKLNNNNSNQNTNFFNMKMFGDINNNINQQMNKEIKLIVKSKNNKLDIVSCMENDKISILENKLNLIEKGYLIHDYRVLSSELTLKEAGIRNGFIINIKPNVINIIFANTTGYISNYFLDEDCPVNMAIAFYSIENNIINRVYDKNVVSFLFNACKLRIYDDTPIKNIFEYRPNPRIIVNDNDNLIGG